MKTPSTTWTYLKIRFYLIPFVKIIKYGRCSVLTRTWVEDGNPNKAVSQLGHHGDTTLQNLLLERKWNERSQPSPSLPHWRAEAFSRKKEQSYLLKAGCCLSWVTWFLSSYSRIYVQTSQDLANPLAYTSQTSKCLVQGIVQLPRYICQKVTPLLQNNCLQNWWLVQFIIFVILFIFIF